MATVPDNIFHIVSIEAWSTARTDETYRPDSLATEGFIHFSYAAQVAATANRYYGAVDGLQVLEIDPGRLDTDLRLERSPSTGELFPHLYEALPIDAVVGTHPLRRDAAGRYEFAFDRSSTDD